MRARSLIRGLACTLLVAGMVTSCSSGSPTDSNDDNPTPAISVTLGTTNPQVLPGGATSVSGTLARTNFTGAVTLSLEGLPTGMSGSATLSGNTIAISLTTISALAVGQYPVTLRATGTGVSSVTANLSVTVSISAPASYLTIGLSSPDLTIVPGNGGTATISIVRTGFAGAVSFTVENVPVYMTASVSPSPTSGNTSTLTISTTDRMASGSYDLIVRGTASGQGDAIAGITITIP